MTDWIDDYAKQLNERQRATNEQRRLTLLQGEIIAERGPQYFERFARSLQTLKREFDEKLGASFREVSLSGTSAPVTLTAASGSYAATLKATPNIKAQQIDLELRLTGPEYSGDPEKKFIRLLVDDENNLVARYELTTFTDEGELASAVLKDALPRDFILRAIGRD